MSLFRFVLGCAFVNEVAKPKRREFSKYETSKLLANCRHIAINKLVAYFGIEIDDEVVDIILNLSYEIGKMWDDEYYIDEFCRQMEFRVSEEKEDEFYDMWQFNKVPDEFIVNK